MITSVEILKKVVKTEITPKMERAIRTQYKAFFAKAETHVIDYDLFYKVEKYKSFNPIEKAKIAYETLSRLYAGIVFNEGFLIFWEDRTQEYLEEIEMESVEGSSVAPLSQNNTVATVHYSEPSGEESTPQMEVIGFISYGDIVVRVLQKKPDFFNDNILAELGA